MVTSSLDFLPKLTERRSASREANPDPVGQLFDINECHYFCFVLFCWGCIRAGGVVVVVVGLGDAAVRGHRPRPRANKCTVGMRQSVIFFYHAACVVPASKGPAILFAQGLSPP